MSGLSDEGFKAACEGREGRMDLPTKEDIDRIKLEVEKYGTMRLEDMRRVLAAAEREMGRPTEREKCAKEIETYHERVYVMNEERHILELVAAELRKGRVP